jgi:hypothetical protein
MGASALRTQMKLPAFSLGRPFRPHDRRLTLPPISWEGDLEPLFSIPVSTGGDGRRRRAGMAGYAPQ